MKPGERQLWRVLNASAITYLNLAVLFNRTPQPLGLVAMDGVPMITAIRRANLSTGRRTRRPAGRARGIHRDRTARRATGLLVTRTVDTGPGGENDPNRMLAKIVASPNAPEPRSTLQSSPEPLPPPSETWLGRRGPVRVRHLYFSEKLAIPTIPPAQWSFT